MRSIFRFLLKPLAFEARKVVGTLTHVSTRAPVRALTFDDAPVQNTHLGFLTYLEKYKARATLLLCGRDGQEAS